MRLTIVVVVLSALLAGCGGGGGEIIPEGIDLMMSSLSGPVNCNWGDAINMDAVLRNRGKTPSALDWAVEIRFSDDAVIDGTDSLLTTYVVNGLAAQTDYPSTDSVTVPASGADGVYYIGYILDAGNAETEDFEDNNTGSWAIYVGAADKPDFVASNIGVPASAVEGGYFSVSGSVQNIAVPMSGQVMVGVYLSTDAVITPATDTVVGWSILSGVPWEAPQIVSVSCRVPQGTAYGTYYVGFYIDPDNLAPEMLETNNEVHDSMNIVDMYEPDDTSPQATPIVINGAAQTHSFVPADESDWVYFVVPNTMDLTITASPLVPPSLDPNFEIYDENLNLLFVGNQPGEEVAYGNNITAGVFYLRIYQGGSVNGGTYTISVTSP